MKKILLIALVILSFQVVGQNISECDTVLLKTDLEIKAAEPCIKQLSEYALTQPMKGCNEEGHYARKVVYAWIGATPDHTFSLNKKIMKIFKDDNLLLFTTYTACLANAALTKGDNFSKYGLELFVNYIRNPKNKVDQSRSVKKLISDWDHNKIDKYFK